MKWKHFFRAAHPQSAVRAEVDKSVVWRINRWVGLRLAYGLYHLGFSANLLSIARFFLAFVGLYLLSLVAAGRKWEPMLGVLCLTVQVNLDFADGPIARAQGKASELGEKMDGLANSCSRGAVLVLAGFLTRSTIGLLVSVVSAHVLVVFMPATELTIRRLGTWRRLAPLYRVVLCVPVMASLLPLLIGLHRIAGVDFVPFSFIIVFVYAVLAAIWLLLCLWEPGRNRAPPERPLT